MYFGRAHHSPPAITYAASLSAGVTTDSRCLDALVVALSHTSGVQSFISSTKQLQLVSLQFCVACRSFRTLGLRIKYATPPRLVADASSSPPKPGQAGYTRVPRFRARSVRWEYVSFKAFRPPMYSLTHVEYMTFCNGGFNDRIEPLAFLSRLKILSLGHYFNHPIDGVAWPRQLETLEFSTNFNHPVVGVDWPPQLKMLTFGRRFNQTIKGVAWPRQLQYLTLDCDFNQPINGVIWPPQLVRLSFGERFNQPIGGAIWPKTLESLYFNDDFNQPIEGAHWPLSLHVLSVGKGFNQRFGGGVWPPALGSLSLGAKYNQPLHGIGTSIPHLRKLTLGFHSWKYPHSLAGVQWPEALEELNMYEDWYRFCRKQKGLFPERLKVGFMDPF